MGLITNVMRRAGSSRYYLRCEVPADLVEAYGGTAGKRKELWKSLGTADPREAKRLARAELDRLEREFDEKRQRRTLDDGDVQAAIWRRYVEIVEADERLRSDVPSDDDLDAVWSKLESEFGEYDLSAYRLFKFASEGAEALRTEYERSRLQRLARHEQLRRDVGRGETRLVADATAQAIKAAGKIVERGEPDYKRLASGLARAEVEALNRAAERDAGDWSGAPRDKLIAPPTIAPAAERVSTLFETYARENPKGAKLDTLNQTRMAVHLFLDSAGKDLHASRIDKRAVRTWKSLLLDYPVKAAETTIFKGLSLVEIIEKNKRSANPKPTISEKTVNRYLSGLGAFCDWLVANDYLDANPLTGMYLHKDAHKITIVPFSTVELNTLFRSPLFIGCENDDKWHVPGDHRIGDHRYWLPLVAMFSGARPGEIAQLLVDDVRDLHGHPILHITREGDPDKSTKTRGSERVVPVHSELVKLGFLDYRDRMKAMGETRLFPGAQRNQRGQMVADYSREFGRYLTRIGLKDGRGLSLYSFRHGVADEFRRAGFLDEQFGPLLGHTSATTTGRYGVMQPGPLKQRVEMIESIKYEGLDLSGILAPPGLARSQ